MKYYNKEGQPFIPWNIDTCPNLPLVLKSKFVKGQFLVTSITEEGIVVSNLNVFIWGTIHKNFTRLDGSPCGEFVNVKNIHKSKK